MDPLHIRYFRHYPAHRLAAAGTPRRRHGWGGGCTRRMGFHRPAGICWIQQKGRHGASRNGGQGHRRRLPPTEVDRRALVVRLAALASSGHEPLARIVVALAVGGGNVGFGVVFSDVLRLRRVVVVAAVFSWFGTRVKIRISVNWMKTKKNVIKRSFHLKRAN